ncbi:cyclin-dependent kinase 10 isoform X2 [Parasteatoda tepidariorum]|uniref:cyclin-dependent kinase 10 isoform X2 n=1 Tax=Parasteatoda tepidariorum TaxID=114398 RepID=UPI001C718991|nr:cyclin-dependent kinase 10 isoform X2 [Parasteatoda tepidariorum]
MPIPGLEHFPVEESSSSSGEGITLLSFDLQPFKIPELHVSGKCRHISEFNKISHIGEGAHDKVLDIKSGEVVALKKLKISKDELACISIYCLREITILKNLEHCNVTHFYGVAVGKSFESTYLIQEYCPFSLSKVIDDEKAIFDQSQIKGVMTQLFEGLAYVHSKHIIHRDLSVTNILFTSSGILKISDFGFSRLTSNGEMTPNVVSRWYRAPEILFGAKTYTSAIDMWAAGCIFAELIHRKPLFPADTDNDMIKLIIDTISSPNETLWPGFTELPLLKNYEIRQQSSNRLRQIFRDQPKTCITLLHKLFLYNPETRYSARSSLQHTYFMDEPHACSEAALVPTLQISETI